MFCISHVMICSSSPNGMVQPPMIMGETEEILAQIMEYVAGIPHNLTLGIGQV